MKVESSLQFLLITASSRCHEESIKLDTHNRDPFFSCFVISVFVCAIALRRCRKALRTWLSCALKAEPSRSFYGSAWVTPLHTITHLHARHTKTATGVAARRNFVWKDWWPQPCQRVRMVWNNVAGSGRRGWACAHSLHSKVQRQTVSPHLSRSLLHVAVPQCARLSKASYFHAEKH